MKTYLHLREPVQPAHRIGATEVTPTGVLLEIDAILGQMVLACGSSIDVRQYEGRWAIIEK